MNYGKRNLARKRKKISSKKTMKKKRVGVRLFQAVLLCIVLIGLFGAAGSAYFVRKIISNSPKVTPEQMKPQGFTSFVYTEDGTEIEQFKEAGSNRVYIPIDELPAYLGQAFVDVEDERFYEHNGIDPKGILRAAFKGITSGNFSEGASTLTQQLIKNNVFPNFTKEKTFYDRVERKLQEQSLAIEIEKKMSKSDILEAYMNTINLGQNTLGVQAAAKRYFGKDAAALTLSEATVIAGITQNPYYYDPVVFPDHNGERRAEILKKMLTAGHITQEDYDTALADTVYDRIQQDPPVVDTTPYTYFVDALAEQVINDLIEKKGYTRTQAHNALYSGGLTITATQDPSIQKIADEEVANVGEYLNVWEYGLDYALTVHRADGSSENYSKEMLAKYLSEQTGDSFPLVFSSEELAYAAIDQYKGSLGIGEDDKIDEVINISPQPQTSVVIMDQYTGKVKAIVGGRGTKTGSLSFDRATDATRQPGSCFKILSTYAPALDLKNYTLATAIEDKGPFKYKDGNVANNWDGVYLGSARMRYAIEHSMNVCAVVTLTDIGEETGFNELKNFGFTTLVENDENGYTDIAQATALGGITRGVYNIEMTAAYAAIANNGVYTKPLLYTKILDHDGNVLIDNSTPDTHQVIKDSTAALLTNAMQDVINKGTGTAARLNNMPAAGKTGTTERETDLWLSAYTPYYTCTVWGGYDSNKPMSSISQVWHETLWKRIMDRVHEGLEYKEFPIPSTVEKRSVCTETGLLASPDCPSYTEYFAVGTAPSTTCTKHTEARLQREKEEKEKKDAAEKEKAAEDAKKKEEEKQKNNSSQTKPATPSEPTPNNSQPAPTPAPGPNANTDSSNSSHNGGTDKPAQPAPTP